MKKLLFILCILTAVPLSASFMGMADFKAKVVKASHKITQKGKTFTRRFSVHLVKWLKGGGHYSGFGKMMAGRTVSIKLRFNSRKEANSISKGSIIQIHYETANSTPRMVNGKLYCPGYKHWTFKKIYKK